MFFVPFLAANDELPEYGPEATGAGTYVQVRNSLPSRPDTGISLCAGKKLTSVTS